MATPKNDAEMDDFRRALTRQGVTQPAATPEPSAWERITAGLKEAADHATGWGSARVKDTFQEAVSRFFGLEPSAQEPSDKQPEPEKGIDR